MKSKGDLWFKRNLTFFGDLLLPSTLRITVQQAVPFWIASLLVGLVAVGYSKLFSLTEHLLTRVLHWHLSMIFILAPVCFLLAWAVVQLFAPNAKGSGIPQVMAAIELSTPKHDVKIIKLLSLRIIITKFISSFLMILGGGAIGREGPTIQIAASVFRMVNQWIPSSWPKLAKQNFILTGAAAGLAAAFNTPLGGIVFAIEELAKAHIRYFRTALFSAVIIAGLTAQGLLGPYLYLGYPDVKGLHYSVFFGVAFTAIVGGILGSLMCKLILKIMQWKKAFTKRKTILYITCSGLLVAVISYFISTSVLGSGKELMNDVLFNTEKSVSWVTVVMRVIGPVIAFNTGAAGGVFAPALAAGAATGGFVADIFHVAGADANILMLAGMVGFLTGVTHTPFTSAILVLEMTDRHSIIFHLMIAALISNMAAFVIDKHSLYEQLKKGYVEDAIANGS